MSLRQNPFYIVLIR